MSDRIWAGNTRCPWAENMDYVRRRGESLADLHKRSTQGSPLKLYGTNRDELVDFLAYGTVEDLGKYWWALVVDAEGHTVDSVLDNSEQYLEVFRRFAAVSGLDVKPGSIRSEKP